MRINNDEEFKDALNGLDVHHQRRVGVAFVERVLSLCKDVRVNAAVTTVKHPNVKEADLESAYQAVNSARIDILARCCKEIDWLAQAADFVARAALICVRAPDQDINLAWGAAMAARLARSCEAVADGTGTDNREAEAQYRILYDFLNK